MHAEIQFGLDKHKWVVIGDQSTLFNSIIHIRSLIDHSAIEDILRQLLTFSAIKVENLLHRLGQQLVTTLLSKFIRPSIVLLLSRKLRCLHQLVQSNLLLSPFLTFKRCIL